MIRILDQGDKSVPWCYISWDKHLIQYLNNGVLVIKSEDLLLNPEVECQRILSNIGIERSKQQILKLAHIVNPVIVKESSDLFVAQPLV